MKESPVPQSGNPAAALPNVVPQTQVPPQEDFWQSFRLFPLRFENYGFQYWYISVLGLFLVIFLLAFVLDIHVMNLEGHGWFFYVNQHAYQDFDYLKAEFTNWLNFLTIVTMIFIVLALKRWWRTIPATLQLLLKRGLISSAPQNSDLNQEYHHFLESYQQALLNKKRYLLIGTSMIVFLTAELIQAIPQYAWLIRSGDRGLSIIGWGELILRATLFSLFFGYFLGAGIWTMLVTGSYVRKLSSEFNLVIQPGYPDHCGGLKPLGNFCLGMVMPILMAATMLGVYSIVSIWYPFLINYASVVRPLASAGLVVFALPLATLVFFAPLWGIHSCMVDKKERYEFDFATRAMKLERRIWSSLDKGALAEAKAAREEMEILQSLHPDKHIYPTWPFDLRIFLVFLAPQFVTILSVVLPLIIHIP